MKIEATGASVESSGIQNSNAFSIKTSAHAFQMLSSGLYGNKIQAVVRELSCNAADAHIDAKKGSIPFEIKVPNVLDSQFYVKDFGNGLSEEQVMRLYTTYFESSKTASNEFTGGFGLGSKSPFAYTDSFTVESRQNGQKKVYAAYVGEDSIPQISKLSEGNTDEANGLTVGFPVKPADMGAFKDEVVKVLYWFSAPVEVKGVSQEAISRFDDLKERTFAYRTETYGIEGEYWSADKHNVAKISNGSLMLRSRKTSAPGFATVVMGNVSYPLEMQSDWKDSVVIKWWKEIKPLFFVPIGLLSVAVSREALAYDKRTQKAAVSFMENAFVDFAKKTVNELNKLISQYSGVEQHQKAGQYLMSLGISNAALVTHYLDAVDASDDLRKVVSVRKVLPFKPRTFDLVTLSNALGTMSNWAQSSVPPQTSEVSPVKGYFVFENATTSFGVDAEKMYKKMLSDKNVSTYSTNILMVVPRRGFASTVEYRNELKKLSAETGFTVETFTGVDLIANSKVRIPAQKFNGGWQWEDTYLTENDTDFYWATKEEWDKFGNKHTITRNIGDFITNLGLPNIEKKMYMVTAADAKAVTKLKGQKPFIDTYLGYLNEPKMVKKISRIKPMLSGYSKTFTRLRAFCRNDANWKAEMSTTEMGKWVEKMLSTKGPASYDFSTMNVLAAFKKYAGDSMLASVPEYYDGALVQNTFDKNYPLLKIGMAGAGNISVDMVKHLTSYVAWRESQGAQPPQQAVTTDISV